MFGKNSLIGTFCYPFVTLQSVDNDFIPEYQLVKYNS